MKKIITLFFVLIFAYPVYATVLQTARGLQEVNNGDILGQNSMWSNTVENLTDVTFYEWNFARQQPDTEVFINCDNITLVRCQLKNVLIPENKGFKLIDCITVKRKEWDANGKHYIEMVNEDDDYELEESVVENIDLIERDFSHLDSIGKEKVRQSYIDAGIPTILLDKITVLNTTKRKATENEKYKVKDIRKPAPNRIN